MGLIQKKQVLKGFSFKLDEPLRAAPPGANELSDTKLVPDGTPSGEAGLSLAEIAEKLKNQKKQEQ